MAHLRGVLWFLADPGPYRFGDPFLGHAVDRMLAGQMKRAMSLAKGGLFLGRMTQMADGLSFILEGQCG